VVVIRRSRRRQTKARSHQRERQNHRDPSHLPFPRSARDYGDRNLRR
jgi:hypothetical protein